MKIAFFSGTFDPVHLGHQASIDEVLAQGLVDLVLVAPEEQPWRKQPVVAFADRVAMLDEVYGGSQAVKVVNSSLESLQKNHSVNSTLTWFRKNYPTDSLYLMMGGDVFERVASWEDFDQLNYFAAGFIVGLRSEDDGETAVEVARQSRVVMTMVSTPRSTVNSSSIRKGTAPRNLSVEGRVAEYIKTHDLYKPID